MVRPRARSILLVVLGVVIGFAVGSGATLTLVDAWFSGRTDPDPEDIAAAGRLQAALEQAGQEQTLLIGPSVRENPAGSGDYELSATLPDDTGLEEVLTIFDGVEATVEQADVSMGDKGRLSLAWTVGGKRMGVEVGLSGTSTGTLRTGLTTALAAAAGDLVAAARYLVRRGTPGLALTAMALHRFVYGMEVITLILMSRNLLAAPGDADAGLEVFGALMGAMVAGHGLAVVLTPLAHERVAPSTWIVVCLVGGTAGQLVLVATHARAAVVAGVLVFGAGVQGAKIAVDTTVQADTADAYRGRAFSIYDVLFNTAECAAAGAAVLVMPAVGWSRGVQAALVVFVWTVALVYRNRVGALGGRPRPVGEHGA